MRTRPARLTRRALPARLNVLRDRPFRLFLLAQLTSWLGDFTAAPALAFAVLDLHGTPDDIGLVLAARSVPLVLFMLLGGVVRGPHRPHRDAPRGPAIHPHSPALLAAWRGRALPLAA